MCTQKLIYTHITGPSHRFNSWLLRESVCAAAAAWLVVISFVCMIFHSPSSNQTCRH